MVNDHKATGFGIECTHATIFYLSTKQNQGCYPKILMSRHQLQIDIVFYDVVSTSMFDYHVAFMVYLNIITMWF